MLEVRGVLCARRGCRWGLSCSHLVRPFWRLCWVDLWVVGWMVARDEVVRSADWWPLRLLTLRIRSCVESLVVSATAH